MIKNKTNSLILLYLIFFVFGIATSSIDPIVPIISQELKIGYDLIGYILFAGFFFLIIANITSGRLGDVANTKYILVGGLVLIMLGSVIFGTIITVALFITITILIRSGYGAIDVSTYTYVSQLFLKDKSAIFVKLNLLWYVGCVIGPAFISLALHLGFNPRLNFLFIGLMFFVLAILFFKLAPGSTQHKKESGKESFISAINYPIVIVSAIILFFYAGSIFGLSTWLTTYFLTFDVQVFMGSVILSLYWIFSIIGLVITTKLLKTTNEITILTIGFILGVASMAVVLLCPVVIIKVVFLLIQAAALSGVFPLVKSIPVSENPKASGTIVGFVLTVQGSGVMVFQPILGVVAENFGGNFIAYVILAGLFIGMLLTFLLLYLLNRKYSSTLKFRKKS